jgi:hypothetical protein
LKEENHKMESPIQDFLSEDEKRIDDVLGYEKWREDGKDDHKKRDIANKLKKQNAVKKLNA